MAHNGKVIPNCVYASNPYHECTDACLTKLKDGPPQKQKKNSDYRRTDGEQGKKMNGEKRTHPDCPKASNPYHECNEHCFKGMSGTDSGVISLKFGRKKKLGSKPELPVLDSIPPSKVGAIYFSDVSYSEKKKDGLKSSERISSKPISGEINYKDPSSNMEQPRSPKSEPESRNDMPVNHKDKAMDSDELCPNPIQTCNEEKKNASHKVVPHPNDTDDLITRATGHMDFSFSGASNSNEDSDDEETQSVVSESRVPIGRYHVKESFAPILQSILHKYGDIGERCHLESIVMRSYYMECVCFVIQELQNTSIMQLTKSKVKELMAILRDVESAQVNVAWLRSIFNEITENMDIINQHRAMQAEKMNSCRDVESLRKKLNSDLEILAQKEKEIADINIRMAETRDRLQELELKSSQLDNSMLSIKSKVENLDGLSLLDELM